MITDRCASCPEEAALLCLCHFPFANDQHFCRNHIDQHINNGINAQYPHCPVTISYKPLIATNEQFNRVQEQLNHLLAIKRRLKEKIRPLYELETKVTQRHESVKSQLPDFHRKQLEEVRLYEEQLKLLEGSLNENLEKMMFDPNYEPSSDFLRSCWEYLKGVQPVFQPRFRLDEIPKNLLKDYKVLKNAISKDEGAATRLLIQAVERHVTSLLEQEKRDQATLSRSQDDIKLNRARTEKAQETLQGAQREYEMALKSLNTSKGQLRILLEGRRRVESQGEFPGCLDFEVPEGTRTTEIVYGVLVCCCWPVVGVFQHMNRHPDITGCPMMEICLLPTCLGCYGAAVNRLRTASIYGMANNHSYLWGCFKYSCMVCNWFWLHQEKTIR